MRADRDRYPFHPPIRCHISRYHKKCQNQQHFIIVPFRVLELSAGEFIPRLFSSGGIHPTIWSSCCIDCRYHYITVPGHPSDGISGDPRFKYSTITLQFRGIHPTIEEIIKTFLLKVPLHYSSGASIRPNRKEVKKWMYHYITVPGHPSDRKFWLFQKLEMVPLHYSSGASIRQRRWWISRGEVPLHYSSGASIRRLYCDNSSINPVPLHYSSGASIRRKGIGSEDIWWVPLHYSSGASIRQQTREREEQERVPLHYSSGASIRQI